MTKEKQGAARGQADFGGAKGEGALGEADDFVCGHAAIGQADAEGGAGFCQIESSDGSAILRTPLCPAGHLPLKGGDWQFGRRLSFCNLGDWRNASDRRKRQKAQSPPSWGDVGGDRGGGTECQLAKDVSCLSDKSLAWASRPFLGNHPERGDGNIACCIFFHCDERLRILPVTGDETPAIGLPASVRAATSRTSAVTGIHGQLPAAIHNDRNLWPQPLRQPGFVNRRPNSFSQRPRIGNLLRIGASQRAGLDRHAGANRDAERINLRRQQPRACRRQPAYLQAAARGYFHDAVAVPQGGFG